MCDFEKEMKSKGEKKVWKNISSSNGSFKKVGQTQLGQQLLMTESIELVEVIRDWIESKCSNIHRKQLQDYFVDDQLLLQKIMDTMLLLTLSSYTSREFNGKSSTRHKRVNLIQKKVMPELSFDITWRFLEVLVEASQYFEVQRQSLFKDAKIYTHLRYICTLPETITVKLAADAHIAFFPEPIVIKPLEWNIDEDGSILGGYHTFQYDLIRSRAGKVNYSKYSKKIFDTVNYIQSVSWKINTKMLDIVIQDIKIPNREDYVKSEYPDSTDSNWEQDIKDEKLSEQEADQIKKARDKYGSLVELYNAEVRDYESAVGKYRAVQLAIGIANRYRDEEHIYFPHSYDSRGRIYPISVGLSPQGSDAIKSMIDYTDGEILTESGESWAWAYLASLFGDDKIAFIHRVERGRELIEANYMEADEPYQFLSHQLELKEFLKDKNYLFKGRVHLDACNSGLI
jgi:hypothetical protein